MKIERIAQAGLTYGKDAYDRERYAELCEIAARMVAERTHLTAEGVLDLFAAEEGYPTPKVDTHAAIFKDGKLLLVHKKNGTRSLPHMFHASILGALRTASRVPYFRSSCFVLRPLSLPCALTSRMKKCKFPTR